MLEGFVEQEHQKFTVFPGVSAQLPDSLFRSDGSAGSILMTKPFR